MHAAPKRSTAALIGDQAEAHEATVLGSAGETLFVVVRLQRPSGKVMPYRLRIEADRPEPKVREETPEHVPTFCPNRHINVGGYFCLSFPSEDPLPVLDADSAGAWWARLLKFLNLQETASALRRWPTTREWAHGDAARHQCRAELCATALGPRFAEALDRRRLTAKRSNAAFLQVRDGKTRLYSVWSKEQRLATLRQACLCGSGLPTVACGDHAKQAAELPFALLAWGKAEAEFWDYARTQTCCGTLRDCPLREPSPLSAANEDLSAQAA
jgi:hypothetical protein